MMVKHIARDKRGLAGIVIVAAVFGMGKAHAYHAPPDCATLQAELYQLSSTGGGTYQLAPTSHITCGNRVEMYGESVSRHALLVPEHVVLDLNSTGEIHLDLSGSGTYGIRLASYATIQNGRIYVTQSCNPGQLKPDGSECDSGSQGIFHSAVSVGAAYGDGGTRDRPSYFSFVHDWSIRQLWVSQPYTHAAIAVMSGSHHGVIEYVTILSSSNSQLGIGLDWGTVGTFQTTDSLIAALQTLYSAPDGPLVFTTHPHDIAIDHISVQHLTRNTSDDDAAIRTSAVYNVTITNVVVDEAANGIVMRAGDVGFEFARPEDRAHAQQGLVVEHFTLNHIHRNGVILDGTVDNVDRASQLPGCKQAQPPVLRTLNAPRVRFGYIRGHFSALAGVYMRYTNAAQLEDIDSEEFIDGILVDNATTNSLVWRSKFTHNLEHGVHIQGGSISPTGMSIVNNDLTLNNVCSLLDLGINTQKSGNQIAPSCP